MLKPLVLKFRPCLSARLKDIAEKHVPANLKPIVVIHLSFTREVVVVLLGTFSPSYLSAKVCGHFRDNHRKSQKNDIR